MGPEVCAAALHHDRQDAHRRGAGRSLRRHRGATPASTPLAGREATRALLLAGVLGLAADALLWEGPVGPGLALWVALLAVSAGLLFPRRAVVRWGAVAVVAAAGTAWRASPEIQLLLFGALLLAAAAVVLEARGRRFGRTRVADQIEALARVPFLATTGALPLLLHAELPRPGISPDSPRRVLALGRGLVLALPPLAIFLALFTAADPVFERAIERLATFGADDLPAHVALVVLFTWVAGGLLRGVLPGPRRTVLARLRPPRIGIEETAVVLGLVATLFAVFVVVQLGYLFGGRAALESVTGLTLAEYARRGFFELVAAAGLVLALLLATGAAAPRGAGRWVFRALAGVLVGLVMVVIASAALRLRLYVAEFGLTTDRFYAAGFMTWLTATLLWYAATVVRGRPRPFASGAHALAVGAIFGLAALNPDALVARTNLDPARERPVDARYLSTLSADAVPVVLARLDALDPVSRCHAANGLEAHRARLAEQEADWRTWNAARSDARRALEATAVELAGAAEGCGGGAGGR